MAPGGPFHLVIAGAAVESESLKVCKVHKTKRSEGLMSEGLKSKIANLRRVCVLQLM